MKLHAREPRDPVVVRGREDTDRWEKAMSYQSRMNGGGESYRGVVAAKQPNEGLGRPQEAVEERPRTKENTPQPHLCRTQSRESRPSGLERVRQAVQ